MAECKERMSTKAMSLCISQPQNCLILIGVARGAAGQLIRHHKVSISVIQLGLNSLFSRIDKF